MSDADRSKWDARYRERGALEQPDAWLVELDGVLPREGFALDVAGGGGRNAIWLARRGLRVWLVDISEEALRIARHRAADAGVALETWRADLESDPLPAGPWDLVLSFHYLERGLFPQFARVLRRGGTLVFSQPTERNLERHERPPRAFLLAEGELATLVPAGLEIVSLTEGWSEDGPDGRHEARLVARRPA